MLKGQVQHMASFPRVKERTREQGSLLIEFAFVLPFLLVFVMGIIEFGRGYNAFHNITNAAREAARLSAYPENNQPLQAPDVIRNRTVNYLNSLGLQTSPYSGAAIKNPSGTTPTTYVYGSYPNGAYLLVNQAELSPIRNSGGTQIGSFVGSKVILSHPYTFAYFPALITLLIPSATYNNQIFIRNSVVMENH